MWVDLIGKPFADGGRGPAAFDCWGLAKEVLKRVGEDVPDFGISALDCRSIDFAISQGIEGTSWKRLDGPELFAVVAIKNHPKYVNHVAVVIAPGLMIHIDRQTAVHVSRINSPEFTNRIVGYYKYVG